MIPRAYQLALVLASIPLYATPATGVSPGLEEATLSGRITDAELGQPLAFVQVTILGQPGGVLSDADGGYSFTLSGDDWTGRDVRLRAELIGYKAVERTVTLTGPVTEVDITMTVDAIGIEFLEVTPGRSWLVPTYLKYTRVLSRITDADSGQPLPDVRVILSGHPEDARSDADGGLFFTLPGDNWTGREVQLRAERIGYETVERAVRITGPVTEVDITMTAGAAEFPESAAVYQGVRIPRRRAIPFGGRTAVEARGTPSAGAARIRAAAPMDYFPPRDPVFNTESYAHIEEADFVGVDDHPLSTFAIDVDRASYANMRRFLTMGTRPPADAIRIEELVNYFPYEYPEPQGEHPFSITAEVGTAPWQPRHRLVRIGLQGIHLETEELPPGNLVFLIDVSGSMRSPGKLPLLKSSLGLLVAQMRPQDRVAIVIYAGNTGLALPPTSGADKTEIFHVLKRLQAGGSTAGGAGLRLAYEVAREHFAENGNNRVILATDGDFNVGPSSDAEMIRLIEKERESGVFLTVLGFGAGNQKDSKMEQLADHGNGNYAYIDGEQEAAKVLVSEFAGTFFTIAKDVKVQVEFNPAEVQAYRLIGYENRALAAQDFADDKKDAGELGAGHSVTALYEVVPTGIEPPDVAAAPALRYREAGAPTGQVGSGELGFVQLRYKHPEGSESILLQQALSDGGGKGSEDLRFAASVAAFGMLFRESKHTGDFSLVDVLDLASGSLGEDEEGYREEFVRLVERAQEQRLLTRERPHR